MKKLNYLLAAVLALFVTSAAISGEIEKSSPDATLKQNAEKGWFFYEKPPVKPPVVQPLPSTTTPPSQEAPKPNKCQSLETWSTDCGFVDPQKDFAFQEKQRDALMQNMIMSKNDPKAVEAFQYYMRWVMQRASDVANIWSYNMAQNPDLDPTLNAPVSAFGLRLMTEVEHGHQREIFKALQNEEGQLVYFSRSDCEFCHSMAATAKSVATKTGLPIWNASLDATCLPTLSKNCGTAPMTIAPAQALQVTTVPTLFLYVKPGTWIRLSTGVTDEVSITTRLASFFAAYRNALLKGVNNGYAGRAPVDFSGTDAEGTAAGVQGASGAARRMPSEDEVARMLGKTK